MNVDAKIKDAKQDTKVTNAAAHWGPRFTVNGVDFSDFKDVTSALHSWDDWCRAWSARAGEHEARGRAALVQKRYGARVVRADSTDQAGRHLYVFRLLSAGGKVWIVRVDARSGAEVP